MKLIVSIEQRPGITKQDMADYIKEAIFGYGGQFHPSDPRFCLTSGGDIEVKPSEYIEETLKFLKNERN